MKVDAIAGVPLAEIGSIAAEVERARFDGIVVPEVAHDPFLPLVLAAASTTSVRLATGIAVAFARNPMTVAVAASDLHRLSSGRFALGIGSQIRAHITRRFSMTWSDPPTKRMREFVAAVRAIWDAWENQTPLHFEGDFYQHTLMTPMFDHGPSPCGWPSIHVAGVGPAMTSLAGEVADGFFCHGFTTADYLRDVTLPNLTKGLAKSGRSRDEIEVSLPVMCAVTDGDPASSLATARSTIAFYGSTRAYRPVLEHHGWGELGEDLHLLSKSGRWSDMSSLISDEILEAFYIVGDVNHVAGVIRTRFHDCVDRIQLGATQPTSLLAVLRAS